MNKLQDLHARFEIDEILKTKTSEVQECIKEAQASTKVYREYIACLLELKKDGATENMFQACQAHVKNAKDLVSKLKGKLKQWNAVLS